MTPRTRRLCNTQERRDERASPMRDESFGPPVTKSSKNRSVPLLKALATLTIVSVAFVGMSHPASAQHRGSWGGGSWGGGGWHGGGWHGGGWHGGGWHGGGW